MTSTVPTPEATEGEAPRLGFPQFLGYAAGDAANNLAFSMSSAFLLLYYTDVAGISAAAVATLFLLVRIFDAFADIFAGRVVDRTMTRWGKFRPFFLFGAVPVLGLSVAVFSVPSGLGGHGDPRVRLRDVRGARARLLARQHPLRLARLGDDPAARRAREARLVPHDRHGLDDHHARVRHGPPDRGFEG